MPRWLLGKPFAKQAAVIAASQRGTLVKFSHTREIALQGLTGVTLLLAFCAVAASSEGETPPSGPGGHLEEIVVTAEKRPERADSVPMSISALGQDKLQELGIADPAELTRAVPGFTYQKSNYGEPVFGIRGVSFNDTAVFSESTVSLYENEVPLLYSALSLGAVLDLDHVEVLKGPQGTLFGQNSTGGAINFVSARPTSTFKSGLDLGYGRFRSLEVGGFVSGPVNDSLRARLSIRSDSGGDWQKSYTRGSSIGGKNLASARLLLDWDASSALRFEVNLNGWRDRSDSQAAQLVAVRLSGRPPFAYRPAVVALTNYPLAPADSRAADWNPGTAFQRRGDFYQASIRGVWEATPSVTLTSISAYTHFKLFFNNDTDGTAYNDFAIGSNAALDSYFQELRLAGEAGDRAKLLIGANYSRHSADETQFASFAGSNSLIPVPTSSGLQVFQPDSTRALNLNTTNTGAVFGAVDYALTRSLTLQTSTRYTDQRTDHQGCFADGGNGKAAQTFGALSTFLSGVPQSVGPGSCLTMDDISRTFQIILPIPKSSLNENNTSWRTGLKWEAQPGVLAYANVSRGFKSGSYQTNNEVFLSQDHAATQEQLTAYEIGAKSTLFQRTADLSGAVFYYDYKNKQLLGVGDSIFGPVPVLVNVPKSRVAGAEVQLEVAPLSGLTGTVAATYVASKVLRHFVTPDPVGVVTDIGGEAFPNTPKWQAFADAQYEFPVSGNLNAFFGGGLTYHSSTFAGVGENPITKIDAYTLLDLRAGVASSDGKWRLQLWGHNVTNKYYWVNAGYVDDVVTRFAGMPATFGATVSYRY